MTSFVIRGEHCHYLRIVVWSKMICHVMGNKFEDVNPGSCVVGEVLVGVREQNPSGIHVCGIFFVWLEHFFNFIFSFFVII